MDISLKNDIWQYLSQSDKPIVMYGTGDGADKIVDVLERCGRTVDDYFASDGFVRFRTFRGKQVLSFDTVKDKYDDFIILQSFGTSLPDVLDRIYSLDSKYEYYAPDVPLYGGELFTYDYYTEHKDIIDAVYDMLADDRSKTVYRSMIEYKLSGKLSFLKDTSDSFSECMSVFGGDYTYFCDGGAYRGETSFAILELFDGIERIYAFEPDAHAYKKLCDASSDSDIDFYAYNAMLSDKAEMHRFYTRKNRSSSSHTLGSVRTDEKSVLIPSYKADDILPKDGKGLIKLDVEGCEKEAIDGAVQSICAGADVQVSLYHRSCDIFSLPQQMKKLTPDAEFYIRRIPYVPAWDTFLSVIQK